MREDVIRHYDLLIAEDNDPVRDPKPLRAYMDKWDGQVFIDRMELNPSASVLEIGVGTGRLALRTAPRCGSFCGVDLSPETIRRARENLAALPNITLLCGDFLTCSFPQRFDVIYSSLTFMHIAEKQAAIRRVSQLLNPLGRFVLSIDKNQSEWLDMGARRLRLYPDNPDQIEEYLRAANLTLTDRLETDFAHLFVARK